MCVCVCDFALSKFPKQLWPPTCLVLEKFATSCYFMNEFLFFCFLIFNQNLLSFQLDSPEVRPNRLAATTITNKCDAVICCYNMLLKASVKFLRWRCVNWCKHRSAHGMGLGIGHAVPIHISFSPIKRRSKHIQNTEKVKRMNLIRFHKRAKHTRTHNVNRMVENPIKMVSLCQIYMFF